MPGQPPNNSKQEESKKLTVSYASILKFKILISNLQFSDAGEWTDIQLLSLQSIADDRSHASYYERRRRRNVHFMIQDTSDTARVHRPYSFIYLKLAMGQNAQAKFSLV